MKLLTDYLQPGTIYFQNRTFEPMEVIAGIKAVADYLSNNIVSLSPFVYLFASNHIKTVLAYFGIIKARRICVIIDPRIGILELNEIMQDTPPAVAIQASPEAETAISRTSLSSSQRRPARYPHSPS